MRTGSMEEELVISVCFKESVHIFCASLISLFLPPFAKFLPLLYAGDFWHLFPWWEWKLVVFQHPFWSWTRLPALLNWTLVQSSQISESSHDVSMTSINLELWWRPLSLGGLYLGLKLNSLSSLPPFPDSTPPHIYKPHWLTPSWEETLSRKWGKSLDREKKT